MSRHVTIDGAAIATPAQAWDALAAALELPAHFGRNLDALFDSLTRDVPGPLAVTWRAAAATERTLGSYFHRLRATLEDAARARSDLTVAFEP
ncbi:MAG: barstar family protein [Alphaproteobacteria bacterium]|nr:barstar family protein [Alphaproteobacteria bacterium]